MIKWVSTHTDMAQKHSVVDVLVDHFRSCLPNLVIKPLVSGPSATSAGNVSWRAGQRNSRGCAQVSDVEVDDVAEMRRVRRDSALQVFVRVLVLVHEDVLGRALYARALGERVRAAAHRERAGGREQDVTLVRVRVKPVQEALAWARVL